MEKIRCVAVDDSPALAKQLRDYITEHPRLEAVLVTDEVSEVMDIIQDLSIQIDLVFTDLQMPDYSGLDVLRALEKRKATKAVLVTGSTIKEEDINSANLMAIVDKPLFPSKFAKVVEDYLALRS